MEILSNKRCKIGEGPIWNEFDNKLYHVNAYEREVCCIDLETKERTDLKFDYAVIALGFTKAGKKVISCKIGAFMVNDDNTRTLLYDGDKYEIRNGNDAKVGPDGRFYIGTQCGLRVGESDKIDGKLYSIDKDGNVKVLLDNLILSNGFDWSMDEKRLYHTDSATGTIREYNFDKETGDISFTGREVYVEGVDGFTIDQNDQLYVACWGHDHVAVVDTADMQIKDYIPVPAHIPASCCFAGENMDKLVVVSANYEVDLSVDKNAGYTFVCDTNTKGRKPFLFG